jgi:hypothetical protein
MTQPGQEFSGIFYFEQLVFLFLPAYGKTQKIPFGNPGAFILRHVPPGRRLRFIKVEQEEAQAR